MRTTIDLPPDLHRIARELAHREGKTLSEVVADLMRRALVRPTAAGVQVSRAGLPVVRIGQPVSNADVATLEAGAVSGRAGFGRPSGRGISRR